MATPRLRLCLNCLSPGGRAFEIGPDRGHQLDRYRETIDLCAVCIEALTEGDLTLFAERNSRERTVRREEV